MFSELKKKDNILFSRSQQNLTAGDTTVVEAEASDGVAWILLILTTIILFILCVVVVSMCCYIRAQKRQRMNAREVKQRSGRDFVAADSDLEAHDSKNMHGQATLQAPV